MPQNYIIKECIKCSAPLIQKDDELVCEYCGARYDLPESYRRQRNRPDAPKPAPLITPEPPKIEEETGNKRKKSTCGVIVVISIFLLLGGVVLFWLFNSLWSVTTVEPITDENQFITDIFRRDSSALPDENPSDFIFKPKFYLGAILNRSDNEDFHLAVYFKNRTESIIDGNSKTNHLMVESVTVIDNTSKTYTCEFSSEVSTTETVSPGDTAYLSSIYCEDGLDPEVKYINVNLKTVHWGAFDFQISVLPVPERLQIRYNLWRQDDEFGLDITFYSKPPQHISVYYDDISVVDSMGNVYVPVYTGDFWDGDLRFFTDLVQNYSHGKDMMLIFDQPFPDEANSVTVNITINGNTISTTTPVDTMEGSILFNREPVE